MPALGLPYIFDYSLASKVTIHTIIQDIKTAAAYCLEKPSEEGCVFPEL